MATRFFSGELTPKQARHKARFSHKWGEKYVCKECGSLMAVCGGDKKQVRVYAVVCGRCNPLAKDLIKGKDLKGGVI